MHNKKVFNNLSEAIKDIKLSSENEKRNFQESLDISVMLDIDVKKSDQAIKGSVVLPSGSGKDVKIVVITDDDDIIKSSLTAGAIMAGTDDVISKINSGFVNFDSCIATPNVMSKMAKIAKRLGPRGLMPNSKNGTVTDEVDIAIQEIKRGKINFKTDRYGIVHSSVGRVDFSIEKLSKNIEAFIIAIKENKPDTVKGKFFNKIYLSSTMGKSVEISLDILNKI